MNEKNTSNDLVSNGVLPCTFQGGVTAKTMEPII